MKNLYQMSDGSCGIVQSAPASKLLESIGVFEGVLLKVGHRYGLGGPVIVSIGTRNIAIGKDTAKKILVQETYN
ncbi:MAG: ferrous iron transport protein A [Clostridiaceae bacterium]|jgi:Fe2+ transport system protein FeoA|nr:ferrous iron transport protein A [Clostridiaceae bacterium]